MFTKLLSQVTILLLKVRYSYEKNLHSLFPLESLRFTLHIRQSTHQSTFSEVTLAFSIPLRLTEK